MIKCLRLRDGDISDEQSWYLEKGYNDHMQAHKDRIEGYFITAEELEQLFQDFDTYRIAKAQNGDYWKMTMKEIFNDYLKQRK